MKKPPVRCQYVKECYLAEDLECSGFKFDCPLYLYSNERTYNKVSFDAAMDELIRKTKRKHDRLNSTK